MYNYVYIKENYLTKTKEFILYFVLNTYIYIFIMLISYDIYKTELFSLKFPNSNGDIQATGNVPSVFVVQLIP